jgi:hypothetical protein
MFRFLRTSLSITLLFLVFMAMGAFAQDTPTPTQTATATPTSTATVTPPPRQGIGIQKELATKLFMEGLYIATGGGLFIGDSGSKISGSYRLVSTIDMSSIAANACLDTQLTRTGVVAGAECTVGAPSTIETGLILNCFAAGANLVKLRACNVTVGAIDPASQSFSVRVFNP